MGDVIVIYKQNKTVSIISPARDKEANDAMYLKRVKGTPMEGMPYDIMDINSLPQVPWSLIRGEKGQPLYSVPPTPEFDKDEFDEWLSKEVQLLPYKDIGWVLTRATDLNSKKAYKRMVDIAKASNVPNEIIKLVKDKLSEMGADIDNAQA